MGISRAYVFDGQSHASALLTVVLTKVKILIDQTSHARLSGFGLITIISDPANGFTSDSYAHGGTARWMSPERIDPGRFGFEDGRPTISSDCYALGMVIYETISGYRPFHEHVDVTVFMKVLNGEHPPRGAQFTDSLWEVVERCWGRRPETRPSIGDVLRCLEMEPSVGPYVEIEEDEVSDGMEDDVSDGVDSVDWHSPDDSCKFPHFIIDYVLT